jgi:hypothetical protein
MTGLVDTVVFQCLKLEMMWCGSRHLLQGTKPLGDLFKVWRTGH